MRWEWWLLGALVCALAGWLLRRYGPDVPGLHVAARVLTIGGLSVVATVTALYVGFFAVLLYWPVVRVFDDGWPLTLAVYAQAAVMFGVVVIGVWPKVLSRLPVLVFAATTLAFSAWLCLHPLEWLPQPS